MVRIELILGRCILWVIVVMGTMTFGGSMKARTIRGCGGS